jgi:hypothetical protein
VTRAVVAAVLVLAVVAVADALRSVGGGPSSRSASSAPSGVTAPAIDAQLDLVRSTRAGFKPAGHFLRTHVVQSGHVVLTPEEIARAFPAQLGGPVDIKDVALSPDGTLVVAVYRFPLDHPARAALEFWRRHRLVGAFTLAPGMLLGGLGFTRDGKLVAAFSGDGMRATLFDRAGNAVADVPL